MINRRNFLFLLTALLPLPAAANFLEKKEVADFIDHMHSTYGFVKSDLYNFFSHLQVNDKVIKLMDAPITPGKKTYWSEYRQLRLKPAKIAEGVRFIRQHKKTLSQVAEKYGTPPEIITAIFAVETNYGKVTGGFNTAQSLATLAFAYPRRAAEFKKELEEFLLYARQSQVRPLQVKGSFAGAFGFPQFLPSSARRFAVDFDGDSKINLFSIADTVGSIGNFLFEHGWRRDGTIALPVESVSHPQPLLEAARANAYKPLYTPQQLRDVGVVANGVVDDELYLLVDLENRYDTEYRLGAQNFYVLTRYNRSFKYAAAITDLSAAYRRHQ